LRWQERNPSLETTVSSPRDGLLAEAVHHGPQRSTRVARNPSPDLTEQARGLGGIASRSRECFFDGDALKGSHFLLQAHRAGFNLARQSDAIDELIELRVSRSNRRKDDNEGTRCRRPTAAGFQGFPY
jgi:hypothetical protein